MSTRLWGKRPCRAVSLQLEDRFLGQARLRPAVSSGGNRLAVWLAAALIGAAAFGASAEAHPGFAPGSHVPDWRLDWRLATVGPLAGLRERELAPMPGEEPAAAGDPIPAPDGAMVPPPPLAGSDEVLADPQARAEILAQLYDALAESSDAQAAEHIESAISDIWHQTGSPTIDLLLVRAEMFEEISEYELALAILDAAIELEPNAAEVWHQRAMVHYLRNEHGEALSDLRHVLALDPRHYQAICGLGRVLESLGQKKAALAVFRKALKVNPYLVPAQAAVDDLSREIEGQDI